MTFRRTLQLIKSDLMRYFDNDKDKNITLFKILRTIYYQEGFICTTIYRINHYLHGMSTKPLKILIKIFTTYTIFKFLQIFFGCSINANAEIGEGLYVGHCGSIIIGPVKMGNAQEGVPTFGDNIYIGPSAKIFGNVHIATNAYIGANSVVTKSIPENAIVLSTVGRIVGYRDPIENKDDSDEG